MLRCFGNLWEGYLRVSQDAVAPTWNDGHVAWRSNANGLGKANPVT